MSPNITLSPEALLRFTSNQKEATLWSADPGGDLSHLRPSLALGHTVPLLWQRDPCCIIDAQ